MTPEEAIAVVDRYYGAYRAGSPTATASALDAVLDAAFVLESPIVEARFGGPVAGPTARAAAAGAAPLLEHAEVEAFYSALDATGVVALIGFPTPAGHMVQSEHFTLDAETRLITRLRSFYDPRPLLGGA